MSGTILLFYNYTSIEHPKQIQKWLRILCQRLKLTGRILIGHEGINGTLGGTTEQTDAFKNEFLHHPLFTQTDMKESPGSADDFPRLSIKIKDEVVAMGVNPEEVTALGGGEHLDPEQTHAIIREKKDLVILDARNNYESRIGLFKGAIAPNIDNFRQFPQYVDDNLEKFKDKEVLMYCTGGIRCERATTYLKEKGVAKKVYQVKGGICRYVEKYPNGYFRGKNYVFDRRIAVRVNDDVLSTCDVCQQPSDSYTNCVNTLCNKQFIACQTCREKLGFTCSSSCQEMIASGKAKERKDRVGVTE